MNREVTLLEDDDYDLNHDVEPEYDFAAIREEAKRQAREYPGILSGMLVRLDPELSAFFKTPEAVTEALRQVMTERQGAA
jgi:hypothetical protein